MAALTDKQLAAQIRNWRKGKNVGPNYGIRCDQAYVGSSQIEVEGVTFRVSECRSELEARELLLENTHAGLALLCRFSDQKLSDDVRARLDKGRLLLVDSRETLRELFEATTIDPQILGNKKLIESLVATVSVSGAVVSNVGALDMDLAWSVLLGRPEIREQQPDLITLLRWSLSDDDWAKVRRLDPEVKSAFFTWVGSHSGEAVQVIAAAEASGHAETLIPTGLVLGSLFDKDAPEHEQLEARVRIEDFTGKKKMERAPAMTLHLAAVAVAKSLSSSERVSIARKVDQLFSAIHGESIAVQSDFSEQGLTKRIQEFAALLQNYGKRKSPDAGRELSQAFFKVQRHFLVGDGRYRQRFERAEMAIRLAIWLKSNAESAFADQGFTEMMRDYLCELSFVDRARFSLHGGDSGEPALSQAYEQLMKQAAKLRRTRQMKWARALAEWNDSPSSSNPLKIESVLSDVVAPLSRQRPVLLLVLDGMSAPVFHELVEDFTRRDWMPLAKEGAPSVTPVIAALPSITEISRKALFSGKIGHADRRTEQVSFRDHPDLAEIEAKSKPQLFLKGDLALAGTSYLNDQVREAISNPTQRVVGVLLNVVDDQLSGADQLQVDWRIDRVRFLEPILEAASSAKRLVVLTSDHGHVPDLNQTSKLVEAGDGADRYRTPSTKAAVDGEVEFSGPRIEAAIDRHSVVLASDECVRYSTKKAGYHGGASDLESIIPLTVLDCEADAPNGWISQLSPPPAWWNWKDSLGATGAPIAKPSRKKAQTVAETNPTSGQSDLPLFGHAGHVSPASAHVAWIEALVASPIFAEQSKLMGKLAPKHLQVTEFLSALERRGDSTLTSILSADLKLPVFRLRGLISTITRLLNVEGYPVLQEEHDSGTVILNKRLLAKQFDLEI